MARHRCLGRAHRKRTGPGSKGASRLFVVWNRRNCRGRNLEDREQSRYHRKQPHHRYVGGGSRLSPGALGQAAGRVIYAPPDAISQQRHQLHLPDRRAFLLKAVSRYPRRLQHARRQRPGNGRAAQECDEVAPSCPSRIKPTKGQHCASQQKLRDDVADGSESALLRCPLNVRFALESDRRADVPVDSFVPKGDI